MPRVRQKNLAATGFLLALTACSGAGTEANRTSMMQNRTALPANIGPSYGNRLPENPAGAVAVAETRTSERDLQQRLAALEQSLVEQRAALERLRVSRAEAEPLHRPYVNRPVTGFNDQRFAEPAASRESRAALEEMVARRREEEQQRNPLTRRYQAYRAGALTPEEQRKFEDDVRNNRIMLPPGGALLGELPRGLTRPSRAFVAPQRLLDAYTSGQLSRNEKIEFERDVKQGILKVPEDFPLENTEELGLLGRLRESMLPARTPPPPTQQGTIPGVQTAPPPAPASQPAASAQTARLQSELDALERERRAAASRAGGPSIEQVQSLERRAIELETALQRFGRI